VPLTSEPKSPEKPIGGARCAGFVFVASQPKSIDLRAGTTELRYENFTPRNGRGNWGGWPPEQAFEQLG
jgi:hypothetical protein